MKPQDHRKALLAEAKATASSRKIKSEEAREIMSLFIRMLEIEIKGAPETNPPATHHV